MNKREIFILILLSISFFSCDFLADTFFKYDNAYLQKYQIRENHNNGDGKFEFEYDGDAVVFQGYSSNGNSLPFPGVSDYPFYMSSYLFVYLLPEFQLSGEGTVTNSDMDITTVYTSTFEQEVAVPYFANIHGTDIIDTIRSSELPDPGNLSVVNFSTESSDPYFKGTGTAVIHSGYPSGVVYFYFHHDNGFTSYLFQISGGGGMGDFFGGMTNQFLWAVFPTIGGSPISSTDWFETEWIVE